MRSKQLLLLFLALAVYFTGCQDSGKNENKPEEQKIISEAPTPEWSHDAVIYEVNIRQYTEEGTFDAFAAHLPRLKELGVDILWLMPVHPIGEENRKGSLGSYYSVKDYKGINPEFGTMEDFKELVKKVHDQDMRIILDWVANHTAWDHPWTQEHPEWYLQNDSGEIIAPHEDWTDVAGLNYDNDEMRTAMTDALTFWVEEANIDGYRCDVAGMVPVDFWESARREIEKEKNVWMLAEDEEETELLEYAFNANYGWSFHHIMNDVANGEKNATHVRDYFHKIDSVYPEEAYPMQFTSNHDENSWNGTVYDRMGEKAAQTMAALTFTVKGMPMIYSGQETGLDKQLEFFEKDRIEWKEDTEMSSLYQTLTDIHADNPALWNGKAGGEMDIIETNEKEHVLYFSREKNDNTVVALFNLSDESKSVTAKEGPEGAFSEVMNDKGANLPVRGVLLQPWEFRIYVQ